MKLFILSFVIFNFLFQSVTFFNLPVHWVYSSDYPHVLSLFIACSLGYCSSGSDKEWSSLIMKMVMTVVVMMPFVVIIFLIEEVGYRNCSSRSSNSSNSNEIRAIAGAGDVVLQLTLSLPHTHTHIYT